MEQGNIPAGSIEAELSVHGTYATNTQGKSMEPLFRTHRDVVMLKRPEGELKKYDIVLYRGVGREHIFVLHRIVKVRENDYVIRGDNTFYLEYVPKDKILGVVVSFNRKGKHHTVDDMSFRLYSRFWNFIYPLRSLKRKLRSALGSIYRKIFRKKRKK